MLQERRLTSVGGNVQKSPSSPVLNRVEGKAAALPGLRSSLRRSRLDARSVLSVREHDKMTTCLREAASAGMEPLACQP